MLEPVITEKTTKLAEEGKYTFLVDRNLNKHQIKELVEKVFGVHVLNIATLKKSGEVKKVSGRKRVIRPQKKAIVKLAKDDKIDLFESKKKSKGKA